MAGIQIVAEEKEEVLILRLSGEIGLSEEYTFRNQINDSMKKPHTKLVVDLQHVSLLSSYGIAAMVNLWKQQQDRGGIVCIICPKNHVYDCLSIAGANKIIPLLEHEEEAMELMRKQ